jgi:hypothetical protein
LDTEHAGPSLVRYDVGQNIPRLTVMQGQAAVIVTPDQSVAADDSSKFPTHFRLASRLYAAPIPMLRYDMIAHHRHVVALV